MDRRAVALSIAVVVALAAALGWAAARRPVAPPTVAPVRLYVAPGLPGALVAELARGFRVAAPVLVPTVDEAELAWLRTPSDVFALGERAVPGSAPEQPRVPGAFVDPKRRYAPIGAIATVLVVPAGSGAAPSELRELESPRLRGGFALQRLGRGDGPRFVAALELAYGERGTKAWLARVAANGPILVDDDAGVVERVASGRAAVGLVDSLTAGSAAAKAGLRVVFPDQKGGGSVVVPTALVVLPTAGPAARKLAAWLAGPDAEEVLARRAVGLLPLRDDAMAADGIPPIWQLAHVTLDWGVLAEREVAWRRRLADWPLGDFSVTPQRGNEVEGSDRLK